jgi:pyridinium-3,5-biscarboxylic acid mononucleotide synthase
MGHCNHHIDYEREDRTGFAEVIYCEMKPDATLRTIVEEMLGRNVNIIGTRATKAQFAIFKAFDSDFEYDENARIAYLVRNGVVKLNGKVVVVTAGSSDYFVAEEAVLTASLLGCEVVRLYDRGVAGLHRILACSDELLSASIVIAIAGMEGALPSVVGGLTDAPVIAVPTSVGYGANFGGLSALLAMLNTCTSGISVVNIDNGFGAGFLAAKTIRKIGGTLDVR